MARSSNANNLAFSSRDKCSSIEAVVAARFQKVSAVPCQNRAAIVWSAVRVVLFVSARLFTSLKSVAYCALVKLGGPGGRKLDGLGITHGVVTAREGLKPLANAGGVGLHLPTATLPVYEEVGRTHRCCAKPRFGRLHFGPKQGQGPLRGRLLYGYWPGWLVSW